MSQENRAVDQQGALIAQLSSETPNGKARAAALAAMPAASRSATSLVSYRSAGQLLIIGKEQQVSRLAGELRDKMSCALLIAAAAGKVVKLADQRTHSPRRRPPPGLPKAVQDLPSARGRLESLSGHLGEFTALLATPKGGTNLARQMGLAREHFDLVLDLTKPPHIQCESLPPGYYAPKGNQQALAQALAEIPELIGEFEKPRYFHYNPDICAHGDSGLKGCTRCLDACPTDAISSIGDTIEVDPYLCQGGGICASACPTGAITYVYPGVADLLQSVRTTLKQYREAGGQQACLLFHDAEAGSATLTRLASQLPERIVPVAIEEIGSLGMDAWLSALAYGANQVALLVTPAVPSLVRRELDAQLGFAHGILTGMGYTPKRLQLIAAQTDKQALAQLAALAAEPELRPASFGPMEEKRTTIRLAVDHLYAQAPMRPAFSALPVGAPFGQIEVDRGGCTLCMACVQVCPHAALSDGAELPQLLFDEWNCVQCGLCETACPEHVITRAPRFLYDPELRRATRTLNEEQPFCCIVCGKPFATQSMIRRMEDKLKGHWMFQKPEARKRMQMCEDCRVKDMLMHEGFVDAYRKPS